MAVIEPWRFPFDLELYKLLLMCFCSQNVLLKYRDQSDYCVACQEVDAQPTDPIDQGKVLKQPNEYLVTEAPA